MIDLKSYFHEKYQGGENFIENVILPIFGEDKYEDAYEEDVLENNPELTHMADTIGISQILRLGTINIPMNPTDVFDITVSNHVQMERNRVNIQQLVRRIISTYSSAFMIFHYDDNTRWDWRFTFCSKQGSNQDTTDSKRYTFLLGPNQSCRTAAENFKKLAEKNGEIEHEDIVTAFDVESLSKEFFGKYKAQYEKFCQYIYTNRTDSSLFGEYFATCEDKLIRDYVKKMLGRLVFLQFLQKKGWLGGTSCQWNDGDLNFLQNLYKNATKEQKEDFLDEILEPLFHNALDGNRAATNQDFDTQVDGFRCCKIPYLNGGLFSIDGQIDDAKSVFPGAYFEELFDFFSQYNFTIDENDPNDAAVGIDPEMLGRIFENLLEDNKDKGAYYTPKEIVQYMCRESLIAYLQTDLKDEDSKEAVRKFVTTYDEALLPEELQQKIDQKLKAIKICDPAIGSGAFPMGLLRELYACRMAIEQKSTSGDICDNLHADIKKEIIQNNIYGVDIEKGAVDIARLRFWLSLILDEEDPKALPNLDFKIVQGNSLLESFHGVDLAVLVEGEKKATAKGLKVNAKTLEKSILFTDEKEALMQIQRSIRQYYNTQDHSSRQHLLVSIENGVRQYLHHRTEGRPELQTEIEDLPLFNDQFFLWHTFFADVFEKGGFDIVIGNPPYITMTKNNTDYKVLKAYVDGFVSIKKCYSKNIFTLFIEFGIINLLRPRGIISYIIPEGLFKTRSYEDCVSMMSANGEVLSYSTFNNYVFENAVTGSLIFNYRKELKGIKPIHFAFDSNYIINVVPEEDTSIFKTIENDTKELAEVAELFKGMVVKDRQTVVYETIDNNPDIFLLGKSIAKWVIKTPLFTDYNNLTIIGGTKKKTKHDVAPRIVIRRTGDTLCCTMLEKAALTESTLYSCWSKDQTLDNRYLIAVLNSNLLDFYNKKKNITNQQGFPQILMTDLQGLPIKVVEKTQQQPIITLVDQILSAKKNDPQADISALEAKIDQLVYKLYGLEDNEIAIIEGQNS